MSYRMIRGSDSEQSEEKAGVELVPAGCAPQTIMCKGPGVRACLGEPEGRSLSVLFTSA